MMPSVVTAADPPRLAIVEEEQFGPVVPVLKYDELDDVIRLVNQSQYGLAASIWTSDEERAFLLGRRFDTGSVFINSHTFTSLDPPRAPFGGGESERLGTRILSSQPGFLHRITNNQPSHRAARPSAVLSPAGSLTNTYSSRS